MAVTLTPHMSLFTLAVVAVTVGPLHYACTATALTPTTMVIGSKGVGEDGHEQYKEE